MKHVNGDIDDLYRRASDKYPLRTDSADWDSLAAALDSGPDGPSDPEDKDRRRRGIFWWWLILLPLGGLGYYIWTHSHAGTAGTQAVVTKQAEGNGATAQGVGRTENRVAAGGTAATGGATGGNGTVENGGAVQKGSAADGEVATSGGKGSNGTGNGGAGNGGNGSTASAGNSGTTAAGSGGKIVAGSDRTVTAGGSGVTGEEVATAGSGKAGKGMKKGAHGRVGTDNQKELFSDKNMTLAGGKKGGAAADGGQNVDREPMLAALDLQRALTAGSYRVNVDVKAPAVKKDSSKAATAAVTKKKSHGYVGVFGSPDFSTVKMQAMKGVGNTFGILLGYAFNDRWAVESGVYLDRKRYYSNGEYFKGELGYARPLDNVDGTCHMVEVPLNVRYNFNTSPRMKWFATAGLSTYLMSSEYYDFVAGNPNSTWGGDWQTHKPSQYYFSIVNVSAGFEQHIGKIGNLRIEPYLRLPLSGIGTGHLPVMSAGINIGITRQLW